MFYDLRRLKIVTAPTIEPVTLADAKLFLKVDETADNALITSLIKAARHVCERYTSRALTAQTWQIFFDIVQGSDHPLSEGISHGADLSYNASALFLPKPPLVSVTHVKTYDDSDVATTWASTNYFVDTATEPGRIVPRSGVSWPTATRVANGIEIQFVAGYAALGTDPETYDIPEDMVTGIKRMINHLYENRGDDPATAAKESGANQLWLPYQIVRI
jgi:uncharacterized phiE125 gp8 family phage protein